jgi:hypothetical protein
MKRLLLPAGALVLVVIACGAGAKPAPQAADSGGRVPAATRTVVVHAPTWSRTVTSPAKVARIVRWFDGLRALRHGKGVACPLVLRPEIAVSFRGAGRAQLAYARVPTPADGICDPIGFRIAGKAAKSLIDRPSGESLARRLDRLLRR